MRSAIVDRIHELRELCLKHRVKTLSLFGSASRSDFRTSAMAEEDVSDLDFLVEFLPQLRGGLNDVALRMHADLEALFGREIDLVEKQVIERSENYIRRQSILESAVPLYAAA